MSGIDAELHRHDLLATAERTRLANGVRRAGRRANLMVRFRKLRRVSIADTVDSAFEGRSSNLGGSAGRGSAAARAATLPPS